MPSDATPNLVLCGFMGCGKTTLAQLLSRRAGMALLDTDDWIAQREGIAISRLFAERGESYFRAVERVAVAEAATRAGTVVSTGGGVPLDPCNAWCLRTTGIVFYVAVPASVLWRRLSGDVVRPLAAGFRSAEDVARRLAIREPCYRALPHHVEAGDRSAEDVAGEILERYEAVREGRRENRE